MINHSAIRNLTPEQKTALARGRKAVAYYGRRNGALKAAISDEAFTRWVKGARDPRIERAVSANMSRLAQNLHSAREVTRRGREA